MLEGYSFNNDYTVCSAVFCNFKILIVIRNYSAPYTSFIVSTNEPYGH